MQGRMIFDNIIIAYETVHAMKNKCTGQVWWLAAKLDMSKAYDNVEWNYLECLMSKMGFATRWVQLIMACVRSVSYSIILNGKQCEHITPARGLNKGIHSPLSIPVVHIRSR